MKKKIITITAPVAVIDSINLMLITLKPQSLVTQKIVLKKMNETINICLN